MKALAIVNNGHKFVATHTSSGMLIFQFGKAGDRAEDAGMVVVDIRDLVQLQRFLAQVLVDTLEEDAELPGGSPDPAAA